MSVGFFGSLVCDFGPLEVKGHGALSDANGAIKVRYSVSLTFPEETCWSAVGQHATNGMVVASSGLRTIPVPGINTVDGLSWTCAPMVGLRASKQGPVHSSVNETYASDLPATCSLKLACELVDGVNFATAATRSIEVSDFCRLTAEDANFAFTVTTSEWKTAIRQLRQEFECSIDGPDPTEPAVFVPCVVRVIDMRSIVAPCMRIGPAVTGAPIGHDDADGGTNSAEVLTCTFAAADASSLPSVAYGVMPLYYVYDHCVHFFRVITGSFIKPNATVRSSLGQTRGQRSLVLASVDARVPKSGTTSPSPCQRGSDEPHRWELLHTIDCSNVILGDHGAAPLIAVIGSAARGLRTVVLSQSNLSLVTARRLVAALKGHPTLQCLSVRGNAKMYEFAGEELLRLLKCNPPLCEVDMLGTSISDRLTSRFTEMMTHKRQQLLRDPFCALSPQFDYLVHMDAVPQPCWSMVLPLWRMLSAVPPAPPSSGTPNTQDDVDAVNHTASLTIGIPLAATAPLLSNVMRSVFIEFSRVYRDPVLRLIFGPVSHVEGASNALSMIDNLQAMYVQSYVKMVVTTLRVALDAPTHWDDATMILRGIGAMHQRCGVQPSMYDLANRYFVDSLCSHFPDDEFGSNEKAAVIQVLALMTRVAVSGSALVV